MVEEMAVCNADVILSLQITPLNTDNNNIHLENNRFLLSKCDILIHIFAFLPYPGNI